MAEEAETTRVDELVKRVTGDLELLVKSASALACENPDMDEDEVAWREGREQAFREAIKVIRDAAPSPSHPREER